MCNNISCVKNDQFDGQPFEFLQLLPPANEVAGRLCFYMCVWFCSQGGMHGFLGGHAFFGGACMVFFGGGMRGFLGFSQVHRIQWDTVNEWAVCILLECILVSFIFVIFLEKHSSMIVQNRGLFVFSLYLTNHFLQICVEIEKYVIHVSGSVLSFTMDGKMQFVFTLQCTNNHSFLFEIIYHFFPLN